MHAINRERWNDCLGRLVMWRLNGKHLSDLSQHRHGRIKIWNDHLSRTHLKRLLYEERTSTIELTALLSCSTLTSATKIDIVPSLLLTLHQLICQSLAPVRPSLVSKTPPRYPDHPRAGTLRFSGCEPWPQTSRWYFSFLSFLPQLHRELKVTWRRSQNNHIVLQKQGGDPKATRLERSISIY